MNLTLGQSVAKGEPLIVTEAMKMETTITAPMAGIVEEILVREGSRIESGDCLNDLVIIQKTSHHGLGGLN